MSIETGGTYRADYSKKRRAWDVLWFGEGHDHSWICEATDKENAKLIAKALNHLSA
jgi:hypothetical protein